MKKEFLFINKFMGTKKDLVIRKELEIFLTSAHTHNFEKEVQ